jgi:hypothetical protein
MLSESEKAQVLAECLDKDKVTVVCGKHKFAYGSKRAPKFNCPQCQFVCFLGLIVNTPPSKRQETMDALESIIHHLIESEERGEIDRTKLYAHPKLTIEREDGRVFNYNFNAKDRT